VTLKLTLEYDGTGFHGWARQPGLRTIEGVVRDAVTAVFPRWKGLAVAGRTDAGVHATGQVASLDAEGGPPAARVSEALNAALPDDVSVLETSEASAGFHALLCAGAYVLPRRSRPHTTCARGPTSALVAAAR
jgi:tRNA pseudouridine38-40 synthase